MQMNGITLIGDTRNSLFTRNYLKSLQVFSQESANHTAASYIKDNVKIN